MLAIVRIDVAHYDRRLHFTNGTITAAWAWRSTAMVFVIEELGELLRKTTERGHGVLNVLGVGRLDKGGQQPALGGSDSSR